MNTRHISLIAIASGLCMAAPSFAMDRVGTLEQGIYECSLPGDATGKAWIVQEDRSFVIISASRYRRDDGRGTYLVTGDDVVFSRGPFKDMRFRKLGSGMLQEVLKDGTLGRLRCHRIARYKP